MFPGKAFEAVWERLARRRAALDTTPRVEPVTPPAEVLAAMSAPPPFLQAQAAAAEHAERVAVVLPDRADVPAADCCGDPAPALETSFEQDAKDAAASEDRLLGLLATEVDVLGATPLQAAQYLFGGSRD